MSVPAGRPQASIEPMMLYNNLPHIYKSANFRHCNPPRASDWPLAPTTFSPPGIFSTVHGGGKRLITQTP
jgi:hypothetical protein